MNEVAQPIDFDSDARSKIVSVFIGNFSGSTARFPYAFRYTISRSVPASTTAPGISPRSMAELIDSSARAKQVRSISRALRMGVVRINVAKTRLFNGRRTIG